MTKYLSRVAVAVRGRLSPARRARRRREGLVGPMGYWEPLQAYQFGFVKGKGLKPHHSLLDVGCEPLQGGVRFIEYLEPGGYVGTDVNVAPLAEGYKQIVEEGLVHKNPTLIRTDSFGEAELGPRTFDFIWASQIIYHLSPENLEMLLRRMAGRMKPTSAFYGDVIDPRQDDPPPASWHEFKWYRHKLDRLQELSARAGLQMAILGPLGELGYPRQVSMRTNTMLEFTLLGDT